MITFKMAQKNAPSPLLTKQLYDRIQSISGKSVAIVDLNGNILEGKENFPKVKQFHLLEPLQSGDSFVRVEEGKETNAVPVCWEGKVVAGVVSALNSDPQDINVISSLAELLVTQFINEHRPKPDATDLLFSRLIYRPESLDQEELGFQLAAMGHRADLPRCAVIIELKGFSDNYLQATGSDPSERSNSIINKKREIESSFNSFFTRSQDNAVGYIGNDLFLVLKDLLYNDYTKFNSLLKKYYPDVTNSLKNIYVKEVTLGVGSAAQSLTSLMASCVQSYNTLTIGKRIYGANKVYSYENLGLLPLVLTGQEDEKTQLASQLLDELIDAELLETLTAFLGCNLNLTATARRLKVHRNTIIYRLNRIEELTGKDPRDFTFAVELYLADLFNKYFKKAQA